MFVPGIPMSKKNTRYHVIREHVEDGFIRMVFVGVYDLEKRSLSSSIGRLWIQPSTWDRF